jgi:HK97 family phage major capsid protein
MNRNEALALREERAGIVRQMGELLDEKGNFIKPENREQHERLDASQADLKTRIDRIERLSGLEQETRQTGRPPAGQPGAGGADSPEIAQQREAKYRSAWARCMQHGLESNPMRGIRGVNEEDRATLMERFRTFELPAEYRDMGTGNTGAYPGAAGTTGGFFVPVGFENDVDIALKYYGPMLSGGVGNPTIMDTATGQILPYPTSNDTTQTGERIAENSTVTVGGADVAIGSIDLYAYQYSTKLIKVSRALLQDSAFGIENFLRDAFAIRLGRTLNLDFTTGAGSGSSAPNGIVTASTSAGTAVGQGGNDGGGSQPNTLGSDDLTTLEHGVDPWYRRNGKYMFHDSTLASLKRVKDKYGRPLWMPSVQVNAPDTLNGYAYLINNDMDQLQAAPASPTVTKKTILFGALDKYLVRRVRGLEVMRLDERYAEIGQVAFIGFARYDGNLIDAGTHPVKYLQNVY